MCHSTRQSGDNQKSSALKGSEQRRDEMFAPTGNNAFDAYIADEIERLRNEHKEFMTFRAQETLKADQHEFHKFQSLQSAVTISGSPTQMVARRLS
jgi:hypothetical protein